MGRKSKSTTIIIYALALCAIESGAADEIYQWVDENGVVNFSQWAPGADLDGVHKRTLADTGPADNDPVEDVYGVSAQAERMKLLRQEMEDKREARRERQRLAAQQSATQYRQPVRNASPYWYGGYYPRPPFRPHPPERPPVPELYETSTLRPLGGSPD